MDSAVCLDAVQELPVTPSSPSADADGAPAAEVEDTTDMDATDDLEPSVEATSGDLIGVVLLLSVLSTFYACIPLFPPLGILPIFGGRSSMDVIARIVVSFLVMPIAITALCCFPLLLIPAVRDALAAPVALASDYYLTPPG